MLEIKVSSCGVCGSDIHMWKSGKGWGKQDTDFVMGHEFWGILINSCYLKKFKIGNGVIFWVNFYCG